MNEQPTKKKRGRGRPATGRKRSKKVNAYVTEAEHTYLKDQAKKLDLTMADYIMFVAKAYEDTQ
ncbi:plasmid mobilization protein [Aerococcus urinae]